MPATEPQWPRASVWLASGAEDPEVLLAGVPSSKSSLTLSQAALAPLEVRQRFNRYSSFHGELGVDFGSLRVRDVGNWPVSELDPVELVDEVMVLAKHLPDVPLRLYVGGDNAITRPLVAALSDDLTSVGLITFDAHHDVRALDDGPSNGSPIRGLIEEHGLPGGNIVQIGIHSFANAAAHRSYSDSAGITTVTLDQVDRIGIRAAVDVALSQLSNTCERVYVDVDVDVLDRAFAPACPGSRPGGMTVRQLAQGVSRCAAHSSVVAMDFVEVDPTADVSHQTVDVLAHLVLTAAAGYATR